MKVLATYSIKGGVGKTTTVVNLAHEAAAAGSRVLLWDLDPQGAATFFARVNPTVKGGAERLVTDAHSLVANIRTMRDIPGFLPTAHTERQCHRTHGSGARPRRALRTNQRRRISVQTALGRHRRPNLDLTHRAGRRRRLRYRFGR